MYNISRRAIEVLTFLMVVVAGIAALFFQLGILLLFFALLLFYFSTIYNTRSATLIDKLIFLLIVFLPFYTIFRIAIVQIGMTQLGKLVNYFRDIVILGMLVYVILEKRRIVLDKQDLPFVFFVFVWLFGLALSTAKGYYLIGLIGLHLSAAPAIIYYVYVYGETSSDTDQFVAAFLKISVCVALIGIVAYFFRPPYYRALFQEAGNQIDAAEYIRFVSVFFTPNVCGSYLSVAFTISLGRLFYNREKRMVFPLVLFLFCIIFTLSRGSWAFVFSVVFVMFAILRPKAGLAVILALPIVLILVQLFDISVFDSFMGNNVKERFLTLFSRSNYSSYGRIDTWIEAFKQLKNSPFGFGAGVSTTAQINKDPNIGIEVIDGFYAKTIVETGALGFAYCVVLVLWTARKSIMCIKSSKEKTIGIITLLVSIGFFVQSFGSNVFDFVCVAPWFWLLLGFSYKEYRKNNIKPC